MDVSVLAYKGEGFSSIIIANTETKCVYRCRKQDVDSSSKANKQQSHESYLKELQGQLNYVEHVMKPLISDSFIPVVKIVNFPLTVLCSLDDSFFSSRPDHRRSRKLDCECPWVLQMPDLCFVQGQSFTTTCQEAGQWPTIAVEIKPKWGLLPLTLATTQSNSVKLTVCRFCMHQHLKVSQGKWKVKSEYCPIDLFSGDLKRIKFALQQLLACPQNNLRLFLNGTVAHAEENPCDDLPKLLSIFGGVDDFVDLVVNALLHVPSNVVTCTNSLVTFPKQQCTRSQFKTEHSNIGQGLPYGSVLYGILLAQWLEQVDIEGVYPLYKELNEKFVSNSSFRSQTNIDGPYEDFWSCCTGCNEANKLQTIKEFLVARTAKDCSIMIAFQLVPPSSQQDSTRTFHAANGNCFAFSISVIDLDAKSFDKIGKYMEEDSDVLNNFVKIL